MVSSPPKPEPIFTASRNRNSFLLFALFIPTAYTLARAALYHLYPVTTTNQWVIRDTIMDVPRLLCFVGALFLIRRHTRIPSIPILPISNDWTSLKPIRLLAIGVIPIALWNNYFSQSTGETFTPIQIALGIISSIAVGLFEETTFRGALFTALRQRFSLLPAVFGTSLLFTLFHLQAQSMSRCIPIFLTGLLFANLRARGLTLASLALIHAATDSFFFLHAANNPAPFSRSDQTLIFGLLAAAILTHPREFRTIIVSRSIKTTF